ncbi:hypothetical protein EV702DRAFT_1127815, partial [Suillus placidus]
DWIVGAGRKYRDPAPRNWLSSGTPFPLNESFRPPPPVSDALRTHIYFSYMANPEVFTTLDDSKPVPVQYDTNQQVAKTHSDRYDAVEADREDEEAGGFDWARQRYQRMFWETVPEGKDPVMPGILDAAMKLASATSENKTKANIVERPGRPAIKFIDVGNMFLNVKEQERRAKESERRAKVRSRRKERQWMAN